MPKNSKTKAHVLETRAQRSPARTARMVLGGLLALNLMAAAMVLYPPGGSAESLEAQLITLQAEVAAGRARLEQTRVQASSVEKGRSEGDEFLMAYFVARRELPSTLLAELNQIADRAGIRDRGSAYTIERIDGSDSLNMVTITANFEGTYRNLLDFVRQVDRSENFLIIESLNATPQPNSNMLTVAMKMEAFVRDEGMPLELASGETAQ